MVGQSHQFVQARTGLDGELKGANILGTPAVLVVKTTQNPGNKFGEINMEELICPPLAGFCTNSIQA